jgi:glycosyltransferase involved in cell wall biosynthesis|nr:glycosyltransferase family A protein [uncultured Flavobacterium sp.]
MNSTSNVTVIIPCYNDSAYIEQAINSIICQTVLPEKIIVIDDGSDEATKVVLRKIVAENLEIIYQQNQGVCNARNRGIDLASTDYILTLDADDFFEPTFIEKAIDVLKNNSKIGVVGSFVNVIKYGKLETEIHKPLGGIVKNFLIKNNAMASLMFRKQCWTEVSGYDENMVQGYEDWEFWIAILRNNWEMHIISEVLFNYRIKKKSRDTVALDLYDFELREYIFLKHKELYKEHFDFYVTELIRQNSILRNNSNKTKKSIDYKIGGLFLTPIRFVKKIVTFKQ